MGKRLTKGQDKKIAGVCSGFADYFGADATLIRIAFLVLVLGYGIGFWFYILAALFMPTE